MQELPERFYRPEDVAQMLGLKVNTVRRWVQTGKLPAFRISAKVVCIDPSDLRAFLDRRRTKGDSR